MAKFQSPRAITWPKIIGPKRNVNLICNLSLYTHIANIKSISQSIAKLEAQWADPVSLIFHSALRKLIRAFHKCFPPSFGSFGQAVSEKNIFRNQSTRNKNFLWQPYLLIDQDEISNLYRGPSIDASYQVSVQLAKQFQGRRFLEIDQSETRIACGGHVC